MWWANRLRCTQHYLFLWLLLLLALLLPLWPVVAVAEVAREEPYTPRTAADICRADDKDWDSDIPQHKLLPPFENVREAGWATDTLEDGNWLDISVNCHQSVNFPQLPFVMEWLRRHLDEHIADTGQKPLPAVGHLQGSGLTAERQKNISFVKVNRHAQSCTPMPHTASYFSMSCSTWNDAATSGRWQLWGATFDLEQKKILTLRDIFMDWDKAAPALTALLKAYYADEDPHVRDAIQTEFDGDWTSFALVPEGLKLLVDGYPMYLWEHMATTVPVEDLRPFVKPGFWPDTKTNTKAGTATGP